MIKGNKANGTISYPLTIIDDFSISAFASIIIDHIKH